MRRLFWKMPRLEDIVRLLVVIGIGSGMGIARMLWSTMRVVPPSPLLYPLREFAGWPETTFLLLLGTLFWVVADRRPRAVIAFLAVAGVSVLFDQTRLQPWLYQYALLLLCLTIPRSFKNEALNGCRLVLAATYIWSGISKIVPEFHEYVFPAFASGLPFSSFLSEHALVFASFSILLEIGIGAGLLFRRTRRFAVASTVLLHLTVLAAFGPSGLHWNMVVWPWNALLVVLVCLLFWNAKSTALQILIGKSRRRIVVTLLAGILPLLGLLGLWDSYLSFSLYSGNLDEAVMDISAEHLSLLPSALPDAKMQEDGRALVSLQSWSFAGLNVPAYPAIRSYRSLIAILCEMPPFIDDLQLHLRTRRTPFASGRTWTETCEDLR